uniref:Cytoplasmic tRNA 2-thiolation protein 1 n=1 Tax=Phallusia mammillata TaxID=59560 RepID=A0A6F9DB15_9ASCI|nr:cytoplasmic tRNA 2-thiolation protein 1-like [Phallusia mammillata]
MPVKCSICHEKNAFLKRPKTGNAVCKECFYWAFELEIHHTITKGKLFKRGEKVAIGASGGKDSTVLAYVLKLLNDRYDYGLELVLLSIDEGITGYRDDSLETVKRNQQQYDLPLLILSYEDLYGWSMDSIVKQIGRKNNCTFCGVFRRQALDRGAMLQKVDKIATGHNADDVAETIIMNILRGDVARLQRCTAIITGDDPSGIPRVKPFKYTYEKEIVAYAYYKKLDYFSTECIYSPNAYRGHARTYLKDLEAIRPSVIIDIIHSGEMMSVKQGVKMPVQSNCTRCGYISSNDICKACVLLEGLNKGKPKLGIGKTSKVKQHFQPTSEKKPTTNNFCKAGGCSSTDSGNTNSCCGANNTTDIEKEQSEDVNEADCSSSVCACNKSTFVRKEIDITTLTI